MLSKVVTVPPRRRTLTGNIPYIVLEGIDRPLSIPPGSLCSCSHRVSPQNLHLHLPRLYHLSGSHLACACTLLQVLLLFDVDPHCPRTGPKRRGKIPCGVPAERS